MYLIVGLGNPGKEYTTTRHNLGYMVIQYLSDEYDVELKNKQFGCIGRTLVKDTQVYFLLPTTYMNDSGKAVQFYKELYQIKLQNILIVVDDLALPFGTIRLRMNGSSGGHNGLKSISSHLHTEQYPRLRIGIGTDMGMIDKAEFVLAPFMKKEQKYLHTIVESASCVAKSYIVEGQEPATRLANLFHLKKTG